jgi:hypothetical protein
MHQLCHDLIIYLFTTIKSAYSFEIGDLEAIHLRDMLFSGNLMSRYIRFHVVLIPLVVIQG